MAKSNKKTVKPSFFTSRSAKIAGTIVAICVVAAGSIGIYTMLNRSSAGAAGATTCGNDYASWASSASKYATLQGYYSKKANKYCFLLVATGTASGKSKAMSVSASGGGSDSGNYKYYAGPVYGSGGASGSITFDKNTYKLNIAAPPSGPQNSIPTGPQRTTTPTTAPTTPTKTPTKQPVPTKQTR